MATFTYAWHYTSHYTDDTNKAVVRYSAASIEGTCRFHRALYSMATFSISLLPLLSPRGYVEVPYYVSS